MANRTAISSANDRTPRRVAVLIESSRSYGRALLAGIAAYARRQTDWLIDFEPRGLDAGPPRWLKSWQGDGVLARVDHPRLAARLRELSVPIVDLRGTVSPDGQPLVAVDNDQLARAAFDHLRATGLKRFGFCGRTDALPHFSQQRGRAFERLAHEAGFPCELFAAGAGGSADRDDEPALRKWLATLAKPIGLFCCFDDRASQVAANCRSLKIPVPDDVAIVGVDQDPILCEMAEPPLTSIDPGGYRVGELAAQWLDRMMAGEPMPRGTLLTAPGALIARRSSDLVAVDSPDIARALRMVRERACGGLNVTELALASGVSRSRLERGFSQELGRSPKQEILRVQLELARRLIQETELPLREVAARSGFSNEKYLSDVCLRMLGSRPGQLRSR